MYSWARHQAFFDRAFNIAGLKGRLDGRHLVVAPADCGELELFESLGVPAKNVTLVGSAEELLDAEDRYPGRRFIADDLRGALKEAPRKLMTARLDARGPISDVFVDRIREVVAHGMNDEGVLSVFFYVGDEVGEIRRLIDQRRGTSSYAAFCPPSHDTPDDLSVLKMRDVVERVTSIQRAIQQKLGNAPVFWEPANVDFYDVGDRVEAVVVGPVRRRPHGTTRVVDEHSDLFLTCLSVGYIENDVVKLHRLVHGYAADVALNIRKLSSEQLAKVVAALFALPIQETATWIETPPPPPPSSSSEPYSSRTSLSDTRSRRLSRR